MDRGDESRKVAMTMICDFGKKYRQRGRVTLRRIPDNL